MTTSDNTSESTNEHTSNIPARWKFDGVRVVKSGELDTNTPQTPGMNRAAAITHARCSAEKLWAKIKGSPISRSYVKGKINPPRCFF